MENSITVYENKLEKKLGLVELSAEEGFYAEPTRLNFKKIKKPNQTKELLEFALFHDGTLLNMVYKPLLTEDLCSIAVKNNGIALYYVPEKWKTPELIDIALGHRIYVKQFYFEKIDCCKPIYDLIIPKSIYIVNDYPINAVPEEMLTNEMVVKSINNSPLSIASVPERFLTKELIETAISIDGLAIRALPKQSMTRHLVDIAVKSNPCSVIYIPKEKLTKEQCRIAYKHNPLLVVYLPEEYTILDMYLSALKACPCDHDRISLFDKFSENIQSNKIIIDYLIEVFGLNYIINHYSAIVNQIYGIDSQSQSLSNKTVTSIISMPKSLPKKVTINAIRLAAPPEPYGFELVENKTSIDYNFVESSIDSVLKIYYITDIHLEHQLSSLTKTSELDIDKFISNKIEKMIQGISTKESFLLIGGDVANSIGLSKRFYRLLKMYWQGTVISVLGNHELWDFNSDVVLESYSFRSIQEIVDDYNGMLNNLNCHLLQNSIYLKYKNQYAKDLVLDEQEIITASDDDLRDLCLKSSLIILGGIGFSGLNPKYNAEYGLYGLTISTIEEDKKLSLEFKTIYDKLNRCAGDRQVIVLTHNPVPDWTNDDYNPHWIYVNGHTHHNSILKRKDGTTVLSDNQIGYKPKEWKLNSISVSGWYDPFESMPDGIHEISASDYKDFNQGRGISTQGYNFAGDIFALKKNDFYFFLVKNKDVLYTLEGGTRKKVTGNYNIKYYYDNMVEFAERFDSIRPYYNYLLDVSNEVKRFGGIGYVHGCIIDIRGFSHLFVNPFDGKITAYWAEDTRDRIVYQNISDLLAQKENELYKPFTECSKNNRLPILSRFIQDNRSNNAIDADFDSDPTIYHVSDKMKKIQYLLEQNVIRAWDEEILRSGAGVERLYLSDNTSSSISSKTVDQNILESEKVSDKEKKDPNQTKSKNPKKLIQYQVGDNINHRIHGSGIVTEIVPVNDQVYKIKVDFDKVGAKSLIMPNGAKDLIQDITLDNEQV